MHNVYAVITVCIFELHFMHSKASKMCLFVGKALTLVSNNPWYQIKIIKLLSGAPCSREACTCGAPIHAAEEIWLSIHDPKKFW